MSDQLTDPVNPEQEILLTQRFNRAIGSFEGVSLSHIEMSNKLANRLNTSIVSGLVILFLIAISIFVLLYTLSSEINRITIVVNNMNVNFSEVSKQMTLVRQHMDSMEKRVAHLQVMNAQTTTMDEQMSIIVKDMEHMSKTVDGISESISKVRGNVENMSSLTNVMDYEMANMSRDMHRMAKPARHFNDFFPW